jgi:hypothetical protein
MDDVWSSAKIALVNYQLLQPLILRKASDTANILKIQNELQGATEGITESVKVLTELQVIQFLPMNA